MTDKLTAEERKRFEKIAEACLRVEGIVKHWIPEHYLGLRENIYQQLVAVAFAERERLLALRKEASAPTKTRVTLSKEKADAVEAEMRRLESDPAAGKHELRLFMQSLMPCGHVVGNLLTCDAPPFGCLECNARDEMEVAGIAVPSCQSALAETGEAASFEMSEEEKKQALAVTEELDGTTTIRKLRAEINRLSAPSPCGHTQADLIETVASFAARGLDNSLQPVVECRACARESLVFAGAIEAAAKHYPLWEDPLEDGSEGDSSVSRCLCGANLEGDASKAGGILPAWQAHIRALHTDASRAALQGLESAAYEKGIRLGYFDSETIIKQGGLNEQECYRPEAEQVAAALEKLVGDATENVVLLRHPDGGTITMKRDAIWFALEQLRIELDSANVCIKKLAQDKADAIAAAHKEERSNAQSLAKTLHNALGHTLPFEECDIQFCAEYQGDFSHPNLQQKLRDELVSVARETGKIRGLVEGLATMDCFLHVRPKECDPASWGACLSCRARAALAASASERSEPAQTEEEKERD